MNEVIKNFNLDSIKIKIPKRSKESHKGNFGKVLVYGGSNGMGGAAILASEASLFCGAGLVYLHTHSSNVEASLKRNPEVMAVGINSEYKIVDDMNIILCGPGLKNDKWSDNVFKKSISKKTKNTIILDAGALLFLKKYRDKFCKSDKLILTPHPGEASKLLDISIDDIQSNRPESAKKIAKKYNADVILKGSETIIYSKEDSALFRCSDGGPELSTGGTGDVLAGIISALVAQNLSNIDACILSVAVHARAGKIFREEIGEVGLNASSLIPIARKILNQ